MTCKGESRVSQRVDPLSRMYGNRLRAVRQEQGLRQVDVATTLGMSTGGYSSVERGVARIFLTDLDRYAGALRVPPAYLARRLGLCPDEQPDIANALVDRFGPEVGPVLVRLDRVLALMERGDTSALTVTLRRHVEPYEATPTR